MASSTPQLASVQRRLADLNTYQLPRLRSCTGPIGLHGELVDELRLDLASVRRGLEVAKEEVEMIEGYNEREGGWRVYEGVARDYKRAQMEYRSALLLSKAQISTTKHPLPSTTTSAGLASTSTRSARDERYELQPSTSAAASSSDPSTTYPPRSSDFGRGEQDAVQTKTNEVTDALRRTLGTMQVELEKSVMSVQMLEDSTRTLRSTSNLYDTYTSLLSTSTQLVKALERADWWDRLIIALAFLLFLLTVGWVIKRRVLDKMVRGASWWVGGSARLVQMGLGRGGGRKGKAKAVGLVAQKGAAVVKSGTAVLGATGALVSAAGAASALSAAKGGEHSQGGGVAPTSIANHVVGSSPPGSASAVSHPGPSGQRDEL